MGTTESKPAFNEALGLLTSQTQPIESGDLGFWDHFWSDSVGSVQHLFAGTTAEDVRSLREKSPANLATLAFKAVEKLLQASETGCSTQQEQQTVLNCVRVLTRVLPFVLEEADWRGLFWTSPSSQVVGEAAADTERQKQDGGERRRSQTAAHAHPPAAHTLISALCDLLFCPDFTVAPTANPNSPDQHEDIQSIDSCEYIWSQGVGFTGSVVHSSQHDANRCELLKLLLTAFSETIFLSADDGDQTSGPNSWVKYFVSSQNRHALPLFTSLLNVVCSYDPVGLGVPYNHLVFSDPRESLVETALHVLIVTLDHNSESAINDEESDDNLFINYLSRIHREEDFEFVLKGFTRLLNNPLTQTYLPHSTKKIQFHQELLVFFWKCCDYNKKFLYFVLKSGDVLHVTVPILFHLNESRADPSRVGLMHIGVFILLLLSGERNFGVRLNKPYQSPVSMDVPIFSGTHGDLLVVVFHKIITTGHQRLQPLFDCLLTIMVNVSPYLKALSMVSSTKLLHLLEAFSTPWFLFSQQNNHHLVFFLLEIFNNIIQYQFDGNSNLVYTIIRKRQVFHALANLPTDVGTIDKSLLSKRSRRGPASTEVSSPAASPADNATASIPVDAAESITDGAVESIPSTVPKSGGQISTGLLPESGTLNATLAATPRLERMTERESAHPPRSSGGILPSSAAGSSLSELPDTPTSVFSGSLSAVDQDGNRKEQSVHVKSPASVGLVSGSPRYDRRASPSVERWTATSHWVASWKNKLPLQTIMRLLQVLVPQVEKICIDKGLTDESEILKFLQHGTLVGLLPVPHPILIRKYQANAGTSLWFRTYMWGVIYLRNVEPPIWFDTDIKLFEVHRN